MNDWLVICFHTRQDVHFVHSGLSLFRQYALMTRLLVNCKQHLGRLFNIFLNTASFSTVIHNHTLQRFHSAVDIAIRLHNGRSGCRIPNSVNYSAMSRQALGINQPHSIGIGELPRRGVSGPGVMLTTHFHLPRRVKNWWSYNSAPLHAMKATTLLLRSAYFQVLTQRVVVIPYRCTGPIGCSETSARNYHTLCIITQKNVVLINFAAEARNRPALPL
jgi:hypothetical protein